MKRIAILGCGNRGADVYAQHLSNAGIQIAYLVDSNPNRLTEVATRLGVPLEAQFSNWESFFQLGRVADAVVIATPDDQHVEPCLQALKLDYDVLLEKPVCMRPEEIPLLLKAEQDSAGQVTVCHVLRATAFFRRIREIIDSGQLGRLVGIQHAENVAYWHYAHSYVRGNWAKSPPAAPFLLAKSCHDLDLLRWFAGAAPSKIHLEGRQHFFKPEFAPAGSAERCMDCTEMTCPYNAEQIYRSRDPNQWPVTVLTAGGISLDEALAHGPYGRCIYHCGNNVNDHEAVAVVFNNGVTAQLTVSAFTHNNTRTLKLMGTHGELRGHMDQGEIEIHPFGQEGIREQIDVTGTHGGGDIALVKEWLAKLAGKSSILPHLAESLDSHLMAFGKV